MPFELRSPAHLWLLGLLVPLVLLYVLRIRREKRTVPSTWLWRSAERDLLAIYGKGARYNAAEHLWRLQTGATWELGQLDGPGDYHKVQGRSLSLLLIDEAQQYPTPRDLDRSHPARRGGHQVVARPGPLLQDQGDVTVEAVGIVASVVAALVLLLVVVLFVVALPDIARYMRLRRM